jgi:hypothetical protein
VFLRSEARDLGFDDKAVAAALRSRVWVRVRRGAYTFADIWQKADPVGRHKIRARAVMRSLGGKVALSHVTAMIEHGALTWDVNLSRVHVTRLDGAAGRTEKDVVHHEGLCLDDDVVEKDGMLLIRPARAAVEAASLASTESALVTLDSALHLELTDPDELVTTFRAMERWPFTQKVHVAVGLADGRAESVGESRSRYLCWVHGLPAPVLQFHVHDASGTLVGITDFAWPDERLLGEFDGKVKYGRLLKPGEEPGDVVFEEKRREDQLREITRWQMVRLVWADLYRGPATAARIRRLMRQAA